MQRVRLPDADEYPVSRVEIADVRGFVNSAQSGVPRRDVKVVFQQDLTFASAYVELGARKVEASTFRTVLYNHDQAALRGLRPRRHGRGNSAGLVIPRGGACRPPMIRPASRPTRRCARPLRRRAP